MTSRMWNKQEVTHLLKERVVVVTVLVPVVVLLPALELSEARRGGEERKLDACLQELTLSCCT